MVRVALLAPSTRSRVQAWTTLRERMTVMGLGHKHVAAAIDKVADTLRAYLDGACVFFCAYLCGLPLTCVAAATRDAAAKVDNWGSRLADAMNGYIRKSEEAKDVFHSKSRNARLAAKILEEAERQAEKGGYTRAALLTESRMTKLREAALRAHEEEQQSGLAYRVSLDTVAKKQNELYTVRMPRVMMELQRLVEQRTVQLRECLLQFVQEAKALGPMLDESLDAVRITVEGINAAIDTKVFVADNVSDDCIPRVFEFVPFDAQSFIPAPGTVIAFDASVGAAGVPAAPPPQAAPESADAAAVRLRATLADAITRQRLQAFVTDATQSAGLQFLLAAQAYRGRPETERTQAASLLYQQYLADDAPEPVQSLLAHETRSALVNNVLRESLDAETFEPASRQVFAALGPVHEDFLRGQAGGSGPPAMPSTPPPKSPKPSLVLLQKPPPDTEDDLLGGSDDELLNRDDNLDDLLEEDLMA